MLFNSYAFVFVFFPVVLVVFYCIGRYSHHLALLWVVAASLFFYGWWDARFVGLLLGSIAFNYGAGFLMGHWLLRKHGRAKWLLAGAISCNLLLLGYFKYANFFLENINRLMDASLHIESVFLPLGISFFTFTQIAFLVDTYQGKVKEYDFLRYALFVSYFPHLIAGPVLHHREMMPQFASKDVSRVKWDNVAMGLTVFVIGLAKKVLVADSLAAFATPVFAAASSGEQPVFFGAWTGALSYTLQLYFDFSAYSDMAIGLSLMFNVRLPMNFDSPYKAASIIDFWKRWHMTLSRFLRDYLYIPLGGNRHGKYKRYMNLMITMLLGGLWHGAGWSFAVWGALHGGYVMINHAWRAVKEQLGWREGGQLAHIASVALTFFAVVVAWVFFRADSIDAAMKILRGMFGFNGVSPHQSLWLGAYAGIFKMIPLGKMIAIGILLVFVLYLAARMQKAAVIVRGLCSECGKMYMPVLLACAFVALKYANLLSPRMVKVALIAFGLYVVWGMKNAEEIAQQMHLHPRPAYYPIALGCIFGATLLAMRHVSEFLYFQF